MASGTEEATLRTQTTSAQLFDGLDELLLDQDEQNMFSISENLYTDAQKHIWTHSSYGWLDRIVLNGKRCVGLVVL